MIINSILTTIEVKTEQAVSQIVINRGGAGSGKSYAIANLLLFKFCTEKNKKILVCRKYLPSLRISILPLFLDIIETVYGWGGIEYEKVFLNLKYKDNLIHFGSVDDAEKYKSTEWNYIFFEEATEFTYKDFQTVRLRLRAKTDSERNQIYMALNPVDEFHWIKEKLIDSGAEDITEIHSTYRDNLFLNDDYKNTLENLANQDLNYYRIYALGQWGRLDHTIYSNWAVGDMPAKGEVFYGLDFGFNAPTAMVKIILYDGVLYEEEVLYKTGLTNRDLIDKLKTIIKLKNAPIYADEAEPARIEEIYRAGFNIHPSEKSVKDGIDFVKRYRVVIAKNSSNLVKEKRSYSYKTDKNGKVIDEPVKYMDHLMDAERYAVYTHLGKKVPFNPAGIKGANKRCVRALPERIFPKI
ncbi:MAG: PBSX family phage terminase large subunit [Candidatus Magnetoovum sp. WYHC-5]|nr:PBSX family phage terminase large subunit [Candidatus Magnetoovum sp. WYHC-5]